ncbi:MAG TPA: phosphatase PAP2 family protein [Solirubrobacteraceae bacterium]|jgi:hypothetical protein|nr:phosphatase PAP2 family protein [Solirubrobacteraceae bacterium]
MAGEAGTLHGFRTPATPERRSRRTLLRDGALNVVVLVWVIWLFDAINNIAPVRQHLAESNGESVLSFERSLHIDPEHALNTWLAARHTLSHIVVFWYFVIHIAVTLSVYVYLWWRRPDVLGPMRSALVIVNFAALAIFWSFPVAPLRMLPGGYVDLVSLVHHEPVWHLGATAVESNQLCSLPSLHIAWATWSSLGIWRATSRRWLRVVVVVYPLITSYAVMATANHYLLDCFVGGALTLAAAWLVSCAGALRARRRAAPQPA